MATTSRPDPSLMFFFLRQLFAAAACTKTSLGVDTLERDDGDR